jgi:hypothetical protein
MQAYNRWIRGLKKRRDDTRHIEDFKRAGKNRKGLRLHRLGGLGLDESPPETAAAHSLAKNSPTGPAPVISTSVSVIVFVMIFVSTLRAGPSRAAEGCHPVLDIARLVSELFRNGSDQAGM